jgi:hypothetical protein
MKSGGQIDAHITFESPVAWCLREIGCEVVRICTETSTVLGAPLADFLLGCGELEILPEDRVRHIPRRIRYLAQYF